jgi:hypothetical protein
VRRHDRGMENFRVLYDLSAADPISEAELDAVEAFFLPVLTRILNGESATEFFRTTASDSEPPQSSAR